MGIMQHSKITENKSKAQSQNPTATAIQNAARLPPTFPAGLASIPASEVRVTAAAAVGKVEVAALVVVLGRGVEVDVPSELLSSPSSPSELLPVLELELELDPRLELEPELEPVEPVEPLLELEELEPEPELELEEDEVPPPRLPLLLLDELLLLLLLEEGDEPPPRGKRASKFRIVRSGGGTRLMSRSRSLS